MRRRLTANDLPLSPEPNVCLVCPECLETRSATRGDYFWMTPGAWFRCGNCRGRPFLQLVRKIVSYEYVPISREPVRVRETTRE